MHQLLVHANNNFLFDQVISTKNLWDFQVVQSVTITSLVSLYIVLVRVS